MCDMEAQINRVTPQGVNTKITVRHWRQQNNFFTTFCKHFAVSRELQRSNLRCHESVSPSKRSQYFIVSLCWMINLTCGRHKMVFTWRLINFMTVGKTAWPWICSIYNSNHLKITEELEKNQRKHKMIPLKKMLTQVSIPLPWSTKKQKITVKDMTSGWGNGRIS